MPDEVIEAHQAKDMVRARYGGIAIPDVVNVAPLPATGRGDVP